MLLALAALAAVGVPDRLPPIDRCRGNAAYDRFRRELVRAVDRKDAKSITALVSDDVMTDFGGGHGKAALKKQWNLDQPARSGLWKELKTILRLGCVYQRGVWLMPSFGDQLDVQLDPLTFVIAIDPVPLLSEPRAGAAAVAQLNWHLLNFHELAGGEGWMKVSLRDGRVGYVRSEHVRSLLDNRMTVRRVGRQLKITALIAGD